MSLDTANGRLLLSVLAMLVGSWGILGWFDLANETQAGFVTDGNHTVTQVYRGSPAQVAGLRPGDHMSHIDGVAVENAATIARQARKKAGEVQRLTLTRDGQTKELLITYGPLPQRELRLAHAAAIVGFCFLLLPLLTFLRQPIEATRVLAVMGIGLSLAFMDGPYIAAFSMRALTAAITSLFVLFGVAALLQFLLVFPQQRPWLRRPWGKTVLYMPAFALWLLIAWRLLFTPAASPALTALTSTLAGVITGSYFLLSLFQVLRNYSRTDQAQRQVLKINSMLLGTVAALVPVTIAQLVAAFSPQSVLPGQDYYFITLALIPLSWARSARLAYG
jgi:membrane-associated protease RseP (regulator of RpoE activity)